MISFPFMVAILSFAVITLFMTLPNPKDKKSKRQND
jgi:hypothetical protein